MATFLVMVGFHAVHAFSLGSALVAELVPEDAGGWGACTGRALFHLFARATATLGPAGPAPQRVESEKNAFACPRRSSVDAAPLSKQTSELESVKDGAGHKSTSDSSGAGMCKESPSTMGTTFF